jgi:hypothetical protein
MRYEELKQFKQVRKYPESVDGAIIPFFVAFLLFALPSPSTLFLLPKIETWTLSCASWICRQQEAVVVGDEPACSVLAVEAREVLLVIRRSCGVVERSWV